MIEIQSTAYIIHNYNRGDNKGLEHMLTKFDNIYYKTKDVALHYDEESKKLYIPRGVDFEYLKRKIRKTHKMVNEDKYNKTSFEITSAPLNNEQKKIIAYLTGNGNFFYTNKYGQLACNPPTGEGKTYCTLATISILKKRALVINYKSDIVEQWLKSAKTHTTLTDDQMLLLRGTKQLEAIMNDEIDISNIELMSTTHHTLREYAKKHGWSAIRQLFKKLRIGIKIFDEADYEFENMLMVDFFSNTSKTVYLTATFSKPDHIDNKIYKFSFMGVPVFGQKLFESKVPEVITLIMEFTSNPTYAEQMKCRTKKGFSATSYCDNQFAHINKPMFKVINKSMSLAENKVSSDGHILIFVTKIDKCDLLKEYLINELDYDKDDIGLYHSKSKEKNVALERKIIISTYKSFGRANDLKGLDVIIDTESGSAKEVIDQKNGRLRGSGLYILLVDRGYNSYKSQLRSRMPAIKKKSKKVIHTKYN